MRVSIAVKAGILLVSAAAIGSATYLTLDSDRLAWFSQRGGEKAYFVSAAEQLLLQPKRQSSDDASAPAPQVAAVVPLDAPAEPKADKGEFQVSALDTKKAEEPAPAASSISGVAPAMHGSDSYGGGSMSMGELFGSRGPMGVGGSAGGFGPGLTATSGTPYSGGSYGGGSGGGFGGSGGGYGGGSGGGTPVAGLSPAPSSSPSTGGNPGPGTSDPGATDPGPAHDPGAPYTGTEPVDGDLVVPIDQVHSPGHSPGKQEISGNYILDGILHMELAGTEAGTEYDQLVIGGDAFLNGLIEVVLLDDFIPEADDVFDILIANDFYFGGDFQVVFPDLPGGHFFTWSLVDLGDGRTAFRLKDPVIEVVAESVPEPATLALFGLGLVGLGVARRRRKTA